MDGVGRVRKSNRISYLKWENITMASNQKGLQPSESSIIGLISLTPISHNSFIFNDLMIFSKDILPVLRYIYPH